ncbi:MAG TPA: 50S ribosomal protein L25/general stress protein Ctc, partial [Bacteroidales bacterium]|nr:50S ribosomal protein L25/general stress protein Ctc [Bacteroidales bacterium]
MKSVSLSGSLRENVGKKDAKKSRKEGKIPCVIYGGESQIHFTLPELAVDKIIFTPEVFILNITIDGKEYQTILQDIQYHPVTDKVLHVDFLEITKGKEVVVGIPVKFNGVAPGIIKGGKLQVKYRKLRVKGLIDNMPEFIELDISKLDIGNSIKVRDLSLDNLQVVETSNAVVVQVKISRGITEEEEENEEGEEGEE